jgi:hypothetical protein
MVTWFLNLQILIVQHLIRYMLSIQILFILNISAGIKRTNQNSKDFFSGNIKDSA